MLYFCQEKTVVLRIPRQMQWTGKTDAYLWEPAVCYTRKAEA